MFLVDNITVLQLVVSFIVSIADMTNKYLQATSRSKRQAQDKLVDAILPAGLLPKVTLVQSEN